MDKLLKLTTSLPVTQLPTRDFKWMIGKHDNDRVAKADYRIPVLVYKLDDGKWVTLDGYHRVAKAISENQKNISVKIVGDDILTKCELR